MIGNFEKMKNKIDRMIIILPINLKYIVFQASNITFYVQIL